MCAILVFVSVTILQDGGNYRELVVMKYDSGFRVHVVIVGHAESPKMKVRIPFSGD